MLEYKGYRGHVELDEEAEIFHGEVLGIRDVVTFQGTSVDELEQAFRDSVDDYLEYCSERGENPDNPFSGRFTVELPPELHRRLYQEAQENRKSLDQIITERLSKAG